MRKTLAQVTKLIDDAKNKYFEIATKYPFAVAYVGALLLGEDFVLFRPPEEYKSVESRHEANARNLVLSVFKKGKISTELGISKFIVDKCVELDDKSLLLEIGNNIANAYETLYNYIKDAVDKHHCHYWLLLRLEEI